MTNRVANRQNALLDLGDDDVTKQAPVFYLSLSDRLAMVQAEQTVTPKGGVDGLVQRAMQALLY